MQTVVYRIVLEGAAPEADETRVRSFLERVKGREQIVEPLLQNFPTELPGSFDFRRASEWLEALARAGIRGRVDVVTEADSETTGGFGTGVVPTPAWPDSPWALWYAMWTQPTCVFRQLRHGTPTAVILFGLALAAFGSALALPGTLSPASSWLGLRPRGNTHLWLGIVFVDPVLALGLWTLLTGLLLRLLRVPANWGTVLGVVALAQVAAPLAALPVGGGALATGTMLWFLGVGCASVYDLEPGKVAGLYLLPAAMIVVPGVLLANLVVMLLGGTDIAGGWSDISWRWLR